MPAPNQPIADFEAKIGLSRLPARGPEASLVDEAALSSLPGLDPSQWELHGQHTMALAPEGVLGQWTLNRGGAEFVSLEVFVSSVDYTTAQRRLVVVAGQTMMRVIPYEPLPLGLGEVCVGLLTGSQDAVFWSTRNVCFRLTTAAPSLDTAALAKRLDALVKVVPFSDLAKLRPSFDDVKVGSTRVGVGESIEVETTLAPSATGADLRTEFRSAGGALFLDQATDTTARFGAAKVGAASIEVAAIDPTTMLATVQLFPAEVVGP